MTRSERIPRDRDNDYSRGQATRRAAFVAARTGVELPHVSSYSIDPDNTRGNIDNFIGTAQVPIGLVRPLRLDGEHAQGNFYVPLATTEGALVASYSRGMRAITESGGARATVMGHSMQRECLEMPGCYGAGKADRFAEIVAAVVLAGDVSLTSAVRAGDWVSSHESLGRNR